MSTQQRGTRSQVEECQCVRFKETMRSMKTTTLLLLALAAFPWLSSAQSYDSSGDSMLNGVYYIRQVVYLVNNCAEPQGTATGGATNTYGNITFDGNGNYTFSG